jgi:hypothetical protein
MLSSKVEAALDGYTDEECPAWNHTEDEGFDQYAVCLRCEHFDDDCPHECGPEFSMSDVADCLEARADTIATIRAELERLHAAEAVCEAAKRMDYEVNRKHREKALSDASRAYQEALDAWEVTR